MTAFNFEFILYLIGTIIIAIALAYFIHIMESEEK